jgi:hypothetical protein
MNWEPIGALAELVGALAVVGSLLYVGRQFRHASTQTTHDIYQQTVNNFSASPENAELVWRGNNDPERLSDAERYHYSMLMANFLFAASLVWEQHEKRIVSDESFKRIMIIAYFYYNTKGGRAYWDGEYTGVPARVFLPAGFADHVESESRNALGGAEVTGHLSKD